MLWWDWCVAGEVVEVLAIADEVEERNPHRDPHVGVDLVPDVDEDDNGGGHSSEDSDEVAGPLRKKATEAEAKWQRFRRVMGIENDDFSSSGGEETRGRRRLALPSLGGHRGFLPRLSNS